MQKRIARAHGGPYCHTMRIHAYIYIHVLIYIYICTVFAHSQWHDSCRRHTSSGLETRSARPETRTRLTCLVSSYREDWKLLSLSLSLSLCLPPRVSAESPEARERESRESPMLETVVRVEGRPQG